MSRRTNRNAIAQAAARGELQSWPTGEARIYCDGRRHFREPADMDGAYFDYGRCSCGHFGLTRLPTESDAPDYVARAAGE